MLLVVIIAVSAGGKGSKSAEKTVAEKSGDSDNTEAKVIEPKIKKNAKAPSKANPVTDFKYDLTEDGSGIIIQSYLETKKNEIRISDKIEDYPVVAIGKEVFKGGKIVGGEIDWDLEVLKGGHVYVLTDIDSGHEFWNEKALNWMPVDKPLEYLYVPRTVTAVYAEAFSSGGWIDVDYSNEKRINISIQNLDIDITKLKTIGDNAFQCVFFKNTDITIPATLEMQTLKKGDSYSWDDYGKKDHYEDISKMFYGSNVTSVQISDGVEIIPTGMFESCHELKEVTIPVSVKEIYTTAFRNCEKLEKVNFPENAQIKYTGGIIPKFGFDPDRKATDAFEGCSALSLKERAKIKATGYEGNF